jgi:hypothetical protein
MIEQGKRWKEKRLDLCACGRWKTKSALSCKHCRGLARGADMKRRSKSILTAFGLSPGGEN